MVFLLVLSAWVTGVFGCRAIHGVLAGLTWQEMATNCTYTRSAKAAEMLLQEARTFLDEGEDAEINALIYVRNGDTGEVLTNVEEWKDLTDTERQALLSSASSYSSPVYQISVTSNRESMVSSLNSTSIQKVGLFKAEVLETLQCDAYDMLLMIDSSYPYTEAESYLAMLRYLNWYAVSWFSEVNVIGFLSVGLTVLIICLILLIQQTGRKKDDVRIHRALMDRFPLELMLIGDAILWGVGIVAFYQLFLRGFVLRIAVRLSYTYENFWLHYLLGGSLFTLLLLLLAWELKRYGRRIKAGDVGGSLIRSVIRGVRRMWEYRRMAVKETRKVAAGQILLLAFHVGIFLVAVPGYSYYRLYAGYRRLLVIPLVVVDLVILVRRMKAAAGKEQIKQGIKALSEGDLEYQINTALLSDTDLAMGEALNRVREGVSIAVDTQMKSERLRADLITNVSHDIKTPLTSIINYVDLLKRENIQDERQAGYVEILDQKARRLKQLTEDLVEASKISSGNIVLDMQRIDLKELLMQTIGEFDERFAARNLQLVSTLPGEEMEICADGRRMHRVVDNLFNNAAKYAMPGTRIYLNGELTEDAVVFSLKNVSENALNINADELLERFVRGDISRTTEGSGLGLEIAKNLTVMQGGDLQLYVDGDLFKVTLRFGRMAADAAAEVREQ